ncbi:myosin-7-like [Callorhinchus milii]|uniref:myosin-7-like n=1 Tax=Callorhinchus milii TaxID=7868 RepID=UPI001C3F61AA|nr:myosin-7-like [Callorhinchus milii]
MQIPNVCDSEMMEDKLTKKQSDQGKKQATGTKSRVKSQELHVTGVKLGAEQNPTQQKRKKDLASFPEKITANLNIKSLQAQPIEVNTENKLRNDRTAELEDHIFQFQNFQSLRGTKFQANQDLHDRKILEEKLRGCEVIVEERTEESRSLRKKLSEMERSYQQVHFDYDALKDKLASVRELESLDSHSSEEETEGNGGTAKPELLQRVKNLEGLLRIKEMSEKELIEASKELESQLLQKKENERLLNLRCAKLDQLTKQKEDIEMKLEERYSQVEKMQKEREDLEEENQEQMKMLLDEIKERDEAYAQLEMINKDLSRKTREMEETRNCLEAKIDQLKIDLEEGIHREVKIKKQFSDLEQTVRDWEHFEQQLREQFKRVEGKLNTKIKRLRKRLEEKGETLERSMQAIEELKKSGKDAEHLLHESQKIPPEILKEKMKLEEELSRMTEAELVKAGSIVKMTSRFEMELSEKSRELEKLTDEIESRNEEIGELQEQLRQRKESERKLLERNKMMEELLQDMQEGESKVLQDKIARMEKLLTMKEETEEKLQVRIVKQVSLLKEMAETQRRLAERNEELGLKQRRLSEELHQWKVKGCDLEKSEREMRNELQCQKDRINELEAAKSNLEVQLENKSHEFDELDFSQKEEKHLMAELNKKIEELVFKESVCQAGNASLETHLKKRTKELEAYEESNKHLRKQLEEILDGREREVKKVKTASEQERRVLETHLSQKSQLITSLETMIQEERHLSASLKHELQNKETAVKKWQEKWLELQTRIQGFKKDLEEAKSERASQATQSELDTLRQRLDECVQSERTLKKTISNFIKAEAALQNRIQDLERSEKQLLSKIDELNSKSLQPEISEPHLAGKLRGLQVSERTLTAVLTEQERADVVVRRNRWHSENQLRMKEEEVKKQYEYFEHHKQKQRQQLAELREREHWLQNRVYELERGMIEGKATHAVLRTELQKATVKAAEQEQASSPWGGASVPATELPEEGNFPMDGVDDVKNHIEMLEQDLKKLLEREEAGNQEKEQLRHSFQQVEDNEDFLGHKLEDLRSWVHQLKLSEGSLQEKVEDLERERRKLTAELEDKQEREEYLREVLEENEKLKLLVEERCQPFESALNESELHFRTGEVQLDQEIAQKESSKHKQLSSLCSAIFHHVVSSHSGQCTTEEQSSPSRYRDLKNSLSHLRSQLQNGDILFREELLRDKWTSLLDPSRNKAIQTPSIGQCVQEAMIIAKLASECIYDYPKFSEAIKEGRLTPLLESHSSPLAEMMQALRCGDVEQVRVVLKRPGTQKELSRLLDLEREQLAREDNSSSMAEKLGTSEIEQENTKYGDDIINPNEITRHAVVTMDPNSSQPQAAVLELANQKVPGAKSSSTSLHTYSSCDNSEPDGHALSRSQLNMQRESSSTEVMAFKGTITTLEAEIQKLQTEKAELDQHLQGKNSLLLKTTAERSELEKKLCATESQVTICLRNLMR